MNTIRISLALSAAILFSASVGHAGTILAPYTNNYSITSIGLPSNSLWGAMAFDPASPNTLYFASNGIFAAPLTRDASGHIIGFAGAATQIASAPNATNGLAFGPGGVLFYSTNTDIGEIKPGDTSPDKIVSNVVSSPNFIGAIAFAPDNPNHLVVLYGQAGGGGWLDYTVSPDGSGTYNIPPFTNAFFTSGRPQGVVWLYPNSPDFPDHTALINFFDYKKLESSPVNATDSVFNLSQTPFSSYGTATGLVQDPFTGDVLYVEGVPNFNSPQIMLISGFAPEPATFLLLALSAPLLLRRTRRNV